MTQGGFTLVELMGGALLTVLILASTIMFFSSLQGTLVRPVVVYNGQNYVLAPVMRSTQDGVSKTDLIDAMDLHQELSNQLLSGDLVVVLGGTNVDGSAPATTQPLKLSFSLQTLTSLAGTSPAATATTPNFVSAAASDLAGYYEPSASVNGFTVLILQGLNQVVSIAQVRRYSVTIDGSARVLYESTLQSRTLPSTAWKTYAYRFWLPPDEDSWSVPIGAVHYWYRNETNWWNRSEQAGSSLVFPDPFVLSVNASDTKVKPMSRFAYFANTSPF